MVSSEVGICVKNEKDLLINHGKKSVMSLALIKTHKQRRHVTIVFHQQQTSTLLKCKHIPHNEHVTRAVSPRNCLFLNKSSLNQSQIL